MNATTKVATATAAVLSGIALSGTALGGIGTSPAHADGSSISHLLTFTEHRAQENQIDLGTTGPSVFDELQFAGLLTVRGNHPSGSDSGICTVTAFTAHRHEALCTAVAQLPGGQLVVTGAEDLSSTTEVFAVTGGTGHYRTATGQVTIRQTGPLTRQVTVELR